MLRVLLTGADGQLAAELLQAFEAPAYDVVSCNRATLDIADAGAVSRMVEHHQPHIILNAAAYNRVDDAETHPVDAFAVNALGPRNLARAAHAREGTILVHYSTDYVFDGRASTPYSEDALPAPLSVYGASKLAGEYFVRAEAPCHYIMRVSGVFGIAGRHTVLGNFVERMLSLGRAGRHLRVVADQVTSPTYAPDIARVTRALIEGNHRHGLYHCASAGTCSWYEFAQAIFQEEGLEVSMEPTTAAAYGASARRPANAVLSSATLTGMGVYVPRHWREALREYVQIRRSDLIVG